MTDSKFKRIQALTVPVLSFKTRLVAYVKILNEMQESSYKSEEGARARGPATVCRVLNLETGEIMDMIVPALVQTTLKDKARDYVGKCYEIHVSAEKKEGKNYKDAEVYEIEDIALPQSHKPQAGTSAKK